MIITDLMEFVGKDVRITLEDGRIADGILIYVPSYSEMFNWHRPKHFYIGFDTENEIGFRCHNVKNCELKEGGRYE